MLESTPSNVSVADLHGGQSYWRALYYFNLYRLLLGTAMVTLAVTKSDFALLGSEDPLLFSVASIGMLCLAVLSLITITASWPAFRIQAYFQFSADAVLITALSHASGGVESGLNLLLIASVAAGGVVLSGRMSLFFAAFATLLALTQQTFETLYSAVLEPQRAFLQVGLLGAGYFTIGGIVYWLARRFHVAEAEAQAREATTVRLNRLNEAIVAQSTVGIAVISNDEHCRLVNEQARRMLDLSRDAQSVPQALIDRIPTGAAGGPTFSFDYRSPVTHLRVQGLHIDEQTDEVALFLEDLAEVEREARNLKLAALGRLTASLAHEIRNPLEAISHAGQLLAESRELGEQDHELAGIIENQTNRIDAIVKSVLQLGRPGAVLRSEVALAPWLERFRAQFNASCGIEGAVAVETTGLRARVRVDADQLNQIMTNVCENALRHTRHLAERPLITVRGFADPRSGAVCVDALDCGPGIDEDIRDKIFEPFFTTNHGGLGLGLFLARQLAENNQGELDYVVEDRTGRFRLILDNAERTDAPTGLRVSHG